MTKKSTLMNSGAAHFLAVMILMLFAFHGLSCSNEGGNTAKKAQKTKMTVYKIASCGCCDKWVTHMEERGFEAEVKVLNTVTPIKEKHGITPELASCHTVLVDGYVIEGHVPAEDVQRLLRERPDVIGLTAPGMPMGSPGMEMGHPEHYDVLTFDTEGNTTVFNSH